MEGGREGSREERREGRKEEREGERDKRSYFFCYCRHFYVSVYLCPDPSPSFSKGPNPLFSGDFLRETGASEDER